MKYILLYNIDELSKNVFLKSYLEDGFEIVSETNHTILIKKNSNSIKEEETYIEILNSYLKRSGMIKDKKGKIIDLTNAFQYAESKNGYDKFDNKFEWYIRNTIIKELLNNDK